MNKITKVKSVFLVILCFVLMCGFTSNKGGVSGVETVMFYYQTDKPPKGGEVLLTMYESNTKYNGFVTSEGTSYQIKVGVTAEPFKNNIEFMGITWYNCHALVNITPECKEKLEKGQLRVDLDSKVSHSKKSEKMSKREIKKVLGVIVIAIGYAIILSKVTGRRKKVD